MSTAPGRRSPYQGLLPFEEGDAPFFFGRERETRLIVANLFASPLTLLYGGSGVGKSSVLRAGAVHQLRSRSDLLVVVFSTWQGDSLRGLHAQLDLAPVNAKPEASPVRGERTLADHIAFIADATGRRLMLILDQFEEYFLYAPDAQAFDEELAEAVVQPNVAANFLLALREDSLAALDRFESSIPNLFDNYLRVEQLDLAAGRTAIVKPIEEYNRRLGGKGRPYEVEPGLVDQVLEEVRAGRVAVEGKGRGSLRSDASERRIETPYLQLVMTRLWDEERKTRSRRLRLQTLKRLGGAGHIVRSHLDATMGALTPQARDVAARVFHFLVTPSGTKIAHTVPDLAEYAGVPQTEISTLIKELERGNVRILRSVAPPSDQPTERRYEIFHDVLAPGVLDWRSRHLRARERRKLEVKLKEEKAQARRQAAEQARQLRQLAALQEAIASVEDAKTRDLLIALVSHMETARKRGKPSRERAAHAERQRISMPLKTWKVGSRLRIRFLDGTPEQRRIVELYAREWTKHANLHFDFGASRDAEIRISFADTGSWSYIGTDATAIRTSEATMNFGWITKSTAREESRRAVLQVFGHAVGLIREHQNPNATIKWNEAAVYRYFTGSPNFWDKWAVENLILRKYALREYREFDLKSIMMMSFPAELTLDHVEYSLNSVLSKSDKAFIRKLYPSSNARIAPRGSRRR